ncbi:hypothetical protein BGW80DRAFT_1335477 [Lactifluus volemus]|nr:hypothetical protein BGW80DRAFT_1335477 [Lactifluus volemus]
MVNLKRAAVTLFALFGLNRPPASCFRRRSLENGRRPSSSHDSHCTNRGDLPLMTPRLSKCHLVLMTLLRIHMIFS